MTSDIPFFRPTVGGAEVAQATESLLSGWLTSGPKTREFEQRFAEAVDAEHAIALNSATAALHLSLVAKDIGPGDEVIIPTLTFAAGAEVVLAVGATPVFVDSIAETLAIDTDAALDRVTSRTRAIMPMHYGGLPVDVSPFMKLAADQPSVSIIEDAAHAFPARDERGPVGAQTHGACFSFYANKTITTGEGGMFTTNDSQFAERVRRLSLHGLSRDAWKRFETRSAWDYDIVEPGWKYNLTDLAAGIGLAQLHRADAMAADRRRTAEFYDNAFASTDAIRPVAAGQRQGSACHLYVIRLASDVTDTTRDDVIRALGDSGIGSSVHYRPLHMHSYHRETFGFEADDFKLDELPQLLNVLRGEMSIVGPRPEVARYVACYPAEFAVLHTVRPGITDPSSLEFRNEEELLGEASDPERFYIDTVLPRKLELSASYVEQQSLATDLRLIFSTLRSVVTR